MHSSNVTRSIGIISVCALTIGILWMTNLEYEQESVQLQEVAVVDAVPEESIWGKMVPKSAVQQRNVRRLALQTELELLIEGITGIEKAHVLLSLHENQGLGHRFIPSTACVTITPRSDARITPNEITAITILIASGVTGLYVDDVTVIDNRDGLIRTGDDRKVASPKVNNEMIRVAVEKALGLSIATVQVDMISPHEGDLFIPWLDNKRPRVRVTLPQSWISRRAEQVGSEQTVMDMISHIAASAAVGSLLELVVVQDYPVATSPTAEVENSAKQWTLIVGLLAILLSGFTVKSRKQEIEKLPAQSMSISKMADFILSLPHDEACAAIDAMHGSRRRSVLHAITKYEAMPVVEVPTRKASELIQCG